MGFLAAPGPCSPSSPGCPPSPPSKGNHGGQPKVIDDDMLTFVVALNGKAAAQAGGNEHPDRRPRLERDG